MYLCRSRSRSRETTCIQRCEYKVYETLASSGLRINFEKNTIMDGKMRDKRQFTGKLYCCPFSFEMLRNLPLHVAKIQIMNRAEPSERAHSTHNTTQRAGIQAPQQTHSKTITSVNSILIRFPVANWQFSMSK